ncbi:hypothetical protein JYG23_02555 [Sedimentibacter sp. zth1]|uniref:hypothetical protein n=1 Tax=Sedimentibacter sp. zth1 TaxID=2816908 RepID=UPI001A917241|nr:hypothetical protein [Sedimentibacter sp. zth1]QSX06360.1 hypothetical protein JYG23_02555 [Sedimentibacter sp. zth1]
MKKKFNIDVFIYIMVAIIVVAIIVLPHFGDELQALEKAQAKRNIKYKYSIQEKDGYYQSDYIKFNVEEWDDLYLKYSGYNEVSEFLHYFDRHVCEINKILKTDLLNNKKILFTLDSKGYGYTDTQNLVICYSKGCFLFDVKKASFINELLSIMVAPSKSDTLTYGLYYYLEQKVNLVLRVNAVEADIICQSKINLNEENQEMLKFIGTSVSIPKIKDDGTKYLDRQIYSTYQFGKSFARYLIDTYGLEKYIELYKSEDIESSYEKLFNKSLDDIKVEWIEYIYKRYKEVYGV